MLTENKLNATGTSKRMPELDALRGLAAMTVILFHFSLTSPANDATKSWWELLLFQVGAERVTFFFVLSGFVLMLSLLHRQSVIEYKAYYARRLMRIYPLYAITTLFVYFVKLWFMQGDISTDYVTPYFNIGWHIPVSIPDLLNTLTLIGNYSTWALNGPAWTLLFEMRISIILPLLILIYNRFPAWSTVGLIIAGGLASWGSAKIPVVDGFFAVNETLSLTYNNIVFLAVFAVGMLLAYKQALVFSLYRSLNHSWRMVWFVLGVMLYINSIWMPLFLGDISYYFNQIVTCVGVVLIMVFCVNNLFASKILSHSFFQFFGRISYGLYLWHFPLLYLFIALFHHCIAIELVFLITISTTILLSWITYTYIEVPFIVWGRQWSERIKSKKIQA